MAALLWSDAEQKLKLIITSAPYSTLIIVFSLFILALAAAAVGIVILLVRRSKSRAEEEEEEDAGKGWVTIRKVLMSSTRWSESSRLAEEEAVMMMSGSSSSSGSSGGGRSWEEGVEEISRVFRPPSSAVGDLRVAPPVPEESPVRRGGSSAAVWQRPILMGEKCELPRFSGLILYDERGRPLRHDRL